MNTKKAIGWIVVVGLLVVGVWYVNRRVETASVPVPNVPVIQQTTVPAPTNCNGHDCKG